MTTPTRGARRLRTALVAALAAVGLLALAGCMKVDMDLTLSEDDTASGSMIMAFSNQLAETMGMDPSELAEQGQGELGNDLPDGATAEPYSDDDYTGTRYTFTDAPIDEISGTGGEDLTITRDGDDYVVDGTMDLSQDMEDLGSVPDGLMDSFEFRIAMTFPGEVSEATGDIDGNTVTWNPQVGESTEIHAVASAEAGSSFPWWLVGLVVGILVIALVVVLVVRSNRSRAAASSGGTAAGPAPDQQVFGTQPAAPAGPAPTTGPVPEPLEPEAPAPSTAPGRPGGDTGPVAEPLEPTQPPDEPGDTDAPRRTDPPQGA